MFLGLRTVIYPAPDLAASTAWYARVLDTRPYFDQPFYVGFQVGGYELGLDPRLTRATGAITYWGVPNADTALAALIQAGATLHSDGVQEVGDGIRTASVRDISGAILGVIENPHFALPVTPPPAGGPGR